MKVFLAGRVAVETDEVVTEFAQFARAAGPAAVRLLGVGHGRSVPRDELAAALWDVMPATWDKACRSW